MSSIKTHIYTLRICDIYCFSAAAVITRPRLTGTLYVPLPVLSVRVHLLNSTAARTSCRIIFFVIGLFCFHFHYYFIASSFSYVFCFVGLSFAYQLFTFVSFSLRIRAVSVYFHLSNSHVQNYCPLLCYSRAVLCSALWFFLLPTPGHIFGIGSSGLFVGETGRAVT